MSLLFEADDLTSAEKQILRSYVHVSKTVFGCQAVRKRINHLLFGFRVVHGEGVFVTISLGRRHSSLMLKLARVRVNDVSLERDDDIAAARRRHAGASSPPIFVNSSCADANGRDTAEVELNIPPLLTRLAMNAQDPLSSVHYYQVCQRL